MTGKLYFAILGTMRSGSNLLEKTIEGLGDTVCYGEAFNPGFVGGPRREEILGWDTVRRDADPLGFLQALRDGAGGAIPGFRLFDGHARAVFEHVMTDPDCRRIVLRRDPVESYISLKIAQETDQWLLRRANKRLAARVTFDAEEFTKYRDRLRAHYKWLEDEMRAVGTSALWVTYDSLLDDYVKETVARYIGSAGTLQAEDPILRQNPQPMAEKVMNYNEMCAFLGIEPVLPEPGGFAGARHVLLSQRAGMAYVPMAGPGFEAGVSMMYRIERRSFDGPSLSFHRLMEGVAAGRVFRSGLTVEQLATACQERCVFTLICHPTQRLHGLFLEEVFGINWLASPIRKRLQDAVGPLPSARELADGKAIVPAERHRRAFIGFLRIVRQALAGQGEIPLRDGWRSQAEFLAAYRRKIDPGQVFRLEDLSALHAWLKDTLPFAGLPENHVTVVRDKALSGPLPLDEVLVPEIAMEVRALHGEDLAEFGYSDDPLVHAA